MVRERGRVRGVGKVPGRGKDGEKRGKTISGKKCRMGQEIVPLVIRFRAKL